MIRTYQNLEYLGTTSSDAFTTSYQKTLEIKSGDSFKALSISNEHAQLPLAIGNYFLIIMFDTVYQSTLSNAHFWIGMGNSGSLKYLTHTVEEYTGGAKNGIVLSSVINMTTANNCSVMLGLDNITGYGSITFTIKRVALVKIDDDRTYESNFSALREAVVSKQSTSYTVNEDTSSSSTSNFVAVSRKNFNKALERITLLENGGATGETQAGRLTGKKIIYVGDSICNGREQNGYSYPALIAELTSCTYENKGVNGASIASIGSNVDSSSYMFPYSVVDGSASLPMDGDLYCFQGGINDYYHNVTLGTFNETDFSSTPDTNTVYGAMEQICRNALYYYKGKPICFILTHKCYNTLTTNTKGYTAKDIHDAQVKVLRKNGIPYFDAFEESGLNGMYNTHRTNYMNGGLSGSADGVHPNKNGYLLYYVPQLISLFARLLPY